MPDRRINYSKWSPEELYRAERTAAKFLQDHGDEINRTFRAKMRCLDVLVTRLHSRSIGLDERLDCFAQIAEIAQMMKDEANGFFELASQPVVARLLSDGRK